MKNASLYWFSLPALPAYFSSRGHPKLAAPFCRSWTVSATQILLFASPLSTLYKAVVSRNSASFHLGLSIMSVISSAMWCIYGIVSQIFTHVTHHSEDFQSFGPLHAIHCDTPQCHSTCFPLWVNSTEVLTPNTCLPLQCSCSFLFGLMIPSLMQKCCCIVCLCTQPCSMAT